MFGWLLILFMSKNVSSLYLEGRLDTNEDWAFLGRFCFLSDIGRLQFDFTYPMNQCCHNLLLYYDDGVQWPAVYKNDSKNCFQKENALENVDYQIIKLTPELLWSGCKNKSISSKWYLHCSGERRFRSKRERWWYMAVSNCQRGVEKKGIDLEYELKLTNGHSYWTQHFSADEFGMMEANIFFFVLFAIILGLSVCAAVNLNERKFLHSTYKLFMFCLFLEALGLLTLSVACTTYASNGIPNKLVEVAGKSLCSVAELLFLLLLLLLAKGFTVTRGRLSYNGTIKFSVFITIYAVVDVILFLYEYVFFDPGLVLYVYESPAGHGWIVLRIIAWLWFTYGVIFTIKNYPEKNGFYYSLYTVYTLWFYAVPIMALIAAYLIPKYMRAKVVNGIERLIDFMAYTVFLFLMRPRAANENFPYHVRTTQIGVADFSGNENSTNFRHNVYEETPSCGQDKVYNLFSVSATVKSRVLQKSDDDTTKVS